MSADPSKVKKSCLYPKTGPILVLQKTSLPSLVRTLCDMPNAVQTLHVQLVGGVKGHEQKVMQSLQQHLQKSKIGLSVTLDPGQKHLALTVLFHRVKPRLPTDELQSLLSAGDASTMLHCGSPSVDHTVHGAVDIFLCKSQQAIS